jgi:hypothetical protein
VALSGAPLVLKRKQFTPSKRERRIAGALLLALVVAAAAVFYPLFEAVDWSRAPDKLLSAPGKLLSGPLPLAELAAALLAGFGHFWYAARAKKRERLFLDERGIRYQSPLPDWLASLQPSWSHSWAQIAGARAVIPKLAFNPNMVTLLIDAVTVRRKLSGMWIPADSADDASGSGMFLFSSHRVVAEQIARDMDQSIVVQHMRRMGVKVDLSEGPRVGFALERNRAALGALVLTFALVAYAVIDWMVNTETYAVKPPVVVYAVAGALVMLACALTLAAKEVPHAETWGVSIVLGAAFAAALYPGLLRVNQLTDREGLKAQQYRLADYVLFKPLDPRLPDLVFIDYHEYWQQFPRGSEHEFLMRKGALDFQQVDMAPVHARMRDFYRSQR